MFRFKMRDPITKQAYILMSHVKDTMNATFVERWTNIWGSYNATEGKYDGMFGDLQSGISEIGGKII